jgi:hypothetical protein
MHLYSTYCYAVSHLEIEKVRMEKRYSQKHHIILVFSIKTLSLAARAGKKLPINKESLQSGS